MKHTLKIFLTILLACGTHTAHAQKKHGQALIDSLLQELPRQKEDTNKVKLLNSLSFAYCTVNPDEGIKYGRQDSALADKLGWKKGIAGADKVLGVNYQAKPDYPNALECDFKALKMYGEIGDKDGMARVDGNVGNIYENQSDYPKALEYDFKALKIDEEIGDKHGIARANGNIGSVYESQSDYPKALEYHFKALKMHEEAGDKDGIAGVTCNIGIVYFRESDYPKALQYWLKALKMYEEMGDKRGIASVTGNIGNVYGQERDCPKALEYYFKALKMQEEIGNKYGIATFTNNIGGVYAMEGDYAKALEYDFKSLKMDEEMGHKDNVERVTGNIGAVYGKQHNYAEAVTWYLSALDIAKEIGDKHGAAINYANLGDAYIGIVIYGGQARANDVVNNAELAQKPYRPAGPGNLIPKGRNAIFHKAIAYLDTAIAINKEIGDLDYLQSSYASLATADSLLGDYKGAYLAYVQYAIFKDSVFSKENAKKIVQQQVKRDYEVREDSIKLETVKNEKVAALRLQRQRSYTYTGIAGMLLLVGFSFVMARERGKSDRERQKSDSLLLNILPAEVAEELKATGGAKARQYDNITVMFTDFVNFTQAGERMSPQALIDELHTCFKAFDEITTKYHIEKIKTIGDAYLAVCGLPTANPQHAENVVSAALEINRYMQDRLAKLGAESSHRTFDIRIGIHSGSVVAGIVGVKKFAYDIWGDTVNTAARMEQSSEAGKINISETTYQSVKGKYNCEYRGEIEAKNKGVMKMYYVS